MPVGQGSSFTNYWFCAARAKKSRKFCAAGISWKWRTRHDSNVWPSPSEQFRLPYAQNRQGTACCAILLKLLKKLKFAFAARILRHALILLQLLREIETEEERIAA